MTDYSTYSDEQLLALLAIDDMVAFREIHDRYWQKLFVTAHFRIGDVPEAEELVQDVLVNLWRKRNDLNLSYSLNTYLAAAMKYEVINRLDRARRRKRAQAKLHVAKPDSQNATEEHLAFVELQDRLAALVKQLPEKCRIVFTLSREAGLSQKEISRRLNISENTVESHIKHALKSLRSGLQNFFLFFF